MNLRQKAKKLKRQVEFYERPLLPTKTVYIPSNEAEVVYLHFARRADVLELANNPCLQKFLIDDAYKQLIESEDFKQCVQIKWIENKMEHTFELRMDLEVLRRKNNGSSKEV